MLEDKDLLSIQEVRTKVEKAYAAWQKYRAYSDLRRSRKSSPPATPRSNGPCSKTKISSPSRRSAPRSKRRTPPGRSTARIQIGGGRENPPHRQLQEVTGHARRQRSPLHPGGPHQGRKGVRRLAEVPRVFRSEEVEKILPTGNSKK